ncbi:MAG: translation initiation factor eIF-1A [DPANN group archaeon]|nr:translation initiation factor eIF-1A [DPANN group archaeon]
MTTVDPTLPQRVRTPRNNELLGIIEQRLGFGKLRVVCSDKKIRICRVPGKYRKRMWLREETYVIVVPWDVQSDERGDIIYKYTKYQVPQLQEKGYLKNLEGH